MGLIRKEDLLDKLEEKYGDLFSPIGCYVNGEWLSVKEIVNVIDDCFEEEE